MCTLLLYTIYICLLENLWYNDFTFKLQITFSILLYGFLLCSMMVRQSYAAQSVE